MIAIQAIVEWIKTIRDGDGRQYPIGVVIENTPMGYFESEAWCIDLMHRLGKRKLSYGAIQQQS